MTRVLLAAISLAFAASSQAAVDDLLKTACSTGKPWRLPQGAEKFTPEITVKLDGALNRMVLICNCTADVAGKNTGIYAQALEVVKEKASWKRAQGTARPPGPEPGPPNWPYYLPGRACMYAGTATVKLVPADKSVETWGTLELEAK